MDKPDTFGEPAALPCADKLAFDTEREANGAATYVQYRHGNALRPYRCRHCGLWHLTGQPA